MKLMRLKYIPQLRSIPVVTVDDITLRDSRREREVPVRIYYPQAQGLFPIIIFSHGAGGSKEAFSSLSCFWASCGYICIHPTHLGNDSSLVKTGGLQAVKQYVNDPRFWQVRPHDVSFLIDSLGELKHRLPDLREKMDESRIGMSGSSYGAYVTMLVAGAIIDTPWEQGVSFRDDRASAFLCISPQGTGKYGLNTHSWSKIEAPMLTISGSKDQGWEAQPPSWRLEAFSYLPPGDKYHVLLEGANHASYDESKDIARPFARRVTQNLTIADKDSSPYWQKQKRIRTYLQNASIVFWDAYLKQENSAKEFLKSDALQVNTNGEVSVFSK